MSLSKDVIKDILMSNIQNGENLDEWENFRKHIIDAYVGNLAEHQFRYYENYLACGTAFNGTYLGLKFPPDIIDTVFSAMTKIATDIEDDVLIIAPWKVKDICEYGYLINNLTPCFGCGFKPGECNFHFV